MKQMRTKKGGWGRLALLCYGAAVLVWLALAVGAMLVDASLPTVQLLPGQAAAEGLVLGSDGAWHSQHADPKLVWQGIGQTARLVLLQAEFSKPPGEMELFYSRGAEAGFTPRRRAIGAPQAGGYLYALPPGRLHALRLDPAATGGVQVRITAITLNPRLPLGHYLIPTLRQALALAIWPGLVLCAVRLWASGRRRRHLPKAAHAGIIGEIVNL